MTSAAPADTLTGPDATPNPAPNPAPNTAPDTPAVTAGPDPWEVFVAAWGTDPVPTPADTDPPPAPPQPQPTATGAAPDPDPRAAGAAAAAAGVLPMQAPAPEPNPPAASVPAAGSVAVAPAVGRSGRLPNGELRRQVAEHLAGRTDACRCREPGHLMRPARIRGRGRPVGRVVAGRTVPRRTSRMPPAGGR